MATEIPVRQLVAIELNHIVSATAVMPTTLEKLVQREAKTIAKSICLPRSING